MAENLHLTYKMTENGVVYSTTLSDRDGAFDFTGWTVTLNVRDKPGGTKILDNLACSANSSGVVSFTVNADSFEDVTLQEKEYAGEFKAVSGSVKEYWPKNKNNKRTYFVFEIQRSLD